MIYESRPNVTVDASILALKSGNSVLLKGGSDAINSNRVIVSAIKRGLEMVGLPEGCVELIEDVSRDCVMEIDENERVFVTDNPRGGSGLIQFVVNNSTVPVIETGTGNCHIFVDYTPIYARLYRSLIMQKHRDRERATPLKRFLCTRRSPGSFSR
jgi:glutamate-5-semialdehyde dehydrogenase